MDETPEEMDQIRREADQIDPYHYRKRRRIMTAIALGAFGAGLVWVVLEAKDKARNPCARVEHYYCAKDAKSLQCQSYRGLLAESVEEASKEMRGTIRQQCLTHIIRVQADDGIKIP